MKKETLNKLLNLYNLTTQKIPSNKIDVSEFFQYLENEVFIGTTSKLYEQFKELHHHDFYEILYIKSGEFKFRVDNKIYNIYPGDMILISPSTLHVLENMSTSNCERIVINFTENYLDDISSEYSNMKLLFDYIDETKNYCISFKNDLKRKIESYIQILLDSQFSDSFGSDLVFNCRFTQLLLLAYQTIIDFEPAEIIYENQLVAKTMEFIQSNISKTFLIEDIAKNANVSASTISHTFKDITGISIYRYITKKRMILAKQLIKKQYTFNEIYSICGFNDYTSFFRAFKREYGITPKEFQRKYTKN